MTHADVTSVKSNTVYCVSPNLLNEWNPCLGANKLASQCGCAVIPEPVFILSLCNVCEIITMLNGHTLTSFGTFPSRIVISVSVVHYSGGLWQLAVPLASALFGDICTAILLHFFCFIGFKVQHYARAHTDTHFFWQSYILRRLADNCIHSQGLFSVKVSADPSLLPSA